MSVLKGLAEEVKLSAYGRQPTTFLSFSFILSLFFLLLTLLMLFFMMPIFITRLEYCFVFQDMHSCVEVWGSTFTPPFPFHPILYLYLYIENNVSFKFGGRKSILLSCYTYCECLIMLFLRIWLNFNYFIGKFKILNAGSFH